jgi:hypothetical protein
MNAKEMSSLLDKLESFRKEVAGDTEKAREFLQQAGILDSEGNLAEPFKNLQLPLED